MCQRYKHKVVCFKASEQKLQKLNFLNHFNNPLESFSSTNQAIALLMTIESYANKQSFEKPLANEAISKGNLEHPSSFFILDFY